MWQKIKCWSGLEPNIYLVSYNFTNKRGNGFGRVLFQARKVNREIVNNWENQIKIELGEDASAVILNIVRLDK